MNAVLDAVLADLAVEGDRLEALVVGLPEDRWRLPTPAAGWDVATQIAHLAWTDEAALAAATDKAAWDALVLAALADIEGIVDSAERTTEVAGVDAFEDAGELPVAETHVVVEVTHRAAPGRLVGGHHLRSRGEPLEHGGGTGQHACDRRATHEEDGGGDPPDDRA